MAETTPNLELKYLEVGGSAVPIMNENLDILDAISGFTVEAAQDAVGAMVGTSLVYVDATPLLARAALTGDATAAQDSNATTVVAASGIFAFPGDISPTQLSANTDDYSPTGLSSAAVLRLSTDASRNLTGIQGGADGRILLLLNVGSNPLVLKNDATSTAANRFLLNGDVTLNGGEAALLWYDSTSSRWRLIGGPSSSIRPRVVALTDAATVTPNADTTDIGTLSSLSQATLIQNPSGTPYDGQRMEIAIASSTSRALTYGTNIVGSTDLPLPAATSGSNLIDTMLLQYFSGPGKWRMMAKNFGFSA